MEDKTPRETELSAALQSVKASREWLAQNELEPERLEELELQAMENALDRAARAGRSMADSGLVLAGLSLTLLVSMLAINYSLSLPGTGDNAVLLFVGFGAALVIAVVMFVSGLKRQGAAFSVMSDIEVFRVRRGRRIREVARSRKRRRAMREMWAAPTSSRTAPAIVSFEQDRP